MKKKTFLIMFTIINWERNAQHTFRNVEFKIETFVRYIFPSTH